MHCRTLATAILFISLMASALAHAVAATADAEQSTFTVGDVSFLMSLPGGFCLPSGRYIELSHETAAMDNRNLTDVSFVKCDDMKKGTDPTEWGC